MANAQILRDQSKKVKEVCVDFRTREDEALAQKLQEEEFETHYIRNRKERGTARIDVKTAKQTYLEEVKSAGLLRDVEYQRLAADDAWLASELQQRLDEEEKLEAHNRAAGEMQDEEYAQYLQEKEKARLEKARHRRIQNRIEQERRETEKVERENLRGNAAEERRPVSEYRQLNSRIPDEKMAGDISVDINNLNVSLPQNSRQEGATAHQSNRHNGMRANHTDQNEFFDIVDQNELIEEERNKEQELKDEEYARQLQRREQEKLRRMMEERDRRLALKMQKKEAEEYRRKRAEREMQKAVSMPESQERVDITHGNNRNGGELLDENQPHSSQDNESTRSEAQSRRFSEQQNHRPTQDKEIRSSNINYNSIPEKQERSSQRSRSSSAAKNGGNEQLNAISMVDDHEQRTKLNPPQRLEDDSRLQNEGIQGKDKTFVNVAAVIDPTYKGDDEEETPHWMERRWGLDDDDSLTSSKPAPVIQNTKRKKSSDKKSRDKGDKCKQQ